MKGKIIAFNGENYEMAQSAYICDCGTVYEAMCYKLEKITKENVYTQKVYFVQWKVFENYDPQDQEEDQACDWSEFIIY